MGVRFTGEAARILVADQHIGNLYRWHLEGADGAWWASAKKYRLVEEVQDDATFCFFLDQIGEIFGAGKFVTEVTADGSVHRDTVEIEGNRLWIQSG